MLDGTRMSIFQKIFSEDFNRIYHSGCEVLYTVQLPGVLASTSTCSTHCTLHIRWFITGLDRCRYRYVYTVDQKGKLYPFNNSKFYKNKIQWAPFSILVHRERTTVEGGDFTISSISVPSKLGNPLPLCFLIYFWFWSQAGFICYLHFAHTWTWTHNTRESGEVRFEIWGVCSVKRHD